MAELEAGDGGGAWIRAWLQPAILIALLAVLGSAYAAMLLQRERIARLEERIAVLETQAQRREVSAAELAEVRHRLAALEGAVAAAPR